MKFKTISAIVLLLLLAYGIWWGVNLVWLRPADIDVFFYRSFMEMEGDEPEKLAEADLNVMDAFRQFNENFADPTGKRARVQQERYRNILSQLQGYASSDLTADKQLSAEALAHELEMRIAGEPFFYHQALFYPGGGAHAALIDYLAHTFPLRDRDEADLYLDRLNAIPGHLRQLRASQKERARQGLLPARPLQQAAIDEIERFLQDSPIRNILYLSFARRAIRVDPTQLNEAEAVEFLIKIEDILTERVYPAYQRTLSELKAQLEQCPESPAATQMKEGEAYYRYCLQRYAETDLSPDTLFAIGQRELQRLQAMVRTESQLIKRPFEGSVAQYLRNISEGKGRYSNDQEGVDKVLDDYRKIINDVRVKITGAIELEPKQKIITVTNQDSFRSAYAPASRYYPVSLGAKEQAGQPVFVQRRAKWVVRLDTLSAYPTWPMRQAAYFHTYPGRHLQLTLQRENESLPMFRRVADWPAFGRGWALYATTLADEVGFHQDPNSVFTRNRHSRLAYLQDQMLHAAMLIIDPGIHHKGWSLEQAMAFLVEQVGIRPGEARYQVWQAAARPGWQCAAWLGQQKILELREKADAQLGRDFLIQDFHALLLRNGSLPLFLVEKAVNDWAAFSTN
jgi:uncharacterized protein (DUF885 family)